MTGNYWPVFSFTCYLSVYLLVNISSIVCKSTLFNITFKISIWCFYTEKIMSNIMYFLKKLLKYLLFLIKKVHEQTAAFDYYKYGLPFSYMVQRWHLQKKWYAVVIFVASCLVWFFYCCFQNVSNILATFLASSKASFLNTCSNIFLISFGLVCIQKKY